MKKLLLAAILGTTGLMSAHATVVTQSDSYGYSSTNWNYQLGALNLFDTTLGTLNKVVVTLSGAIQQHLFAENLGASSDTLIPISGGTIYFQKGTTTTLAQVLPTTTGSGFAATAYDGVTDNAGTSGVDFGILSSADMTTITFTSAAALADFMGTGTMAGFRLRAVGAGSIGSDNGNITYTTLTQAFGKLDLAYDYTAATPSNNVPEPGSMALMAIGLVGMAAARRKKA
ncbi:hypothetical protein os1_44020 [Comamonadaceae bacterium OS-1]|nr:hypothetical protein os1_44020 [Comamonadaceae bacterium OS-1]